ncbi:MAG: hypothetical protein K0S78_1220, partial [Thermomicrobiales bacterium]|nr:hypothetical protein [Thermomicrobiales bacterium]
MESSWVDKFSRVPTAAPEWYGDEDAPYPGPVGRYPHPRPWYRPYGGTVIIPGGGWGGPGSSSSGPGGPGGGGAVPGAGGGWNIPDVQDFSNQAGQSLQASSGSLFDLFNS